MDGDDLWSAAVTGDQDYHAKPAMKKQDVPSHNYSSNHDEQDYGNVNKDYYTADRPKFYSSKKSYDEGQYNYGDAQNNQPNSKRQKFYSPSQKPNSKRQNLGVQTTQQLASKKHFPDKRNQFNLTSLKGNKLPGNHATSDHQPTSDSVNKPVSSSNNYQWKAPIRNNFVAPPSYIKNTQTSQQNNVSDDHTLHPNSAKDGILLGSSHEDKVLFYNTRANSGTEQSKYVGEPDSSKTAWEDYNKYHYVKKKKPNDKENFKKNFKQGYTQDQSSIQDKFGRDEHQHDDVVDERIKQLYNESLKEKESDGRDTNSFSWFDAIVESNTGRFSDRETENGSRYGSGAADGSHKFGGGGAERSGWHGIGYQERGDRYGSKEFDRDGRFGFRDSEDGGRYESRDGEDGSRYGGRDGEDGGRYGGRDGGDGSWYGGRDGKDSDRYGGRETDTFCNRDVERGSRFDDRDLGREGRFDNREPGRDDNYNSRRVGRFEDSSRIEKAYYILEKDKEPGRDYGVEKQRYPVKGNRDRNTGYPVKGNKNASYRNGQEFNHTHEHLKNDSIKLPYKQLAYIKDNAIIPNQNSDGTRKRGSFDMKPLKHEKKKSNKEESIKQMLIDAGNKSVLSFRKSRLEAPLLDNMGTLPNSYATTIGSNLFNSIGSTTGPGGNPIIKYIVPMGNQPVMYPAGNLMGNPLVNPYTNLDASMNPVALNSATNQCVSGADKDGNTDVNPSNAESFPDAADDDVISSGNIFHNPAAVGNPLYPVANPPANAVIKPMNPMLNPLINPVSMMPQMRFVPPLQYIPPGALPVPTPNMPFIVRYNAMPAPVMRHPILNHVTIPPPNETPYLPSPLPQNFVPPNIQNMPPSNIPQVDQDCDIAFDGNTPQPLMSLNICENNPRPLMNFPVANSITPQPLMNLNSGILPDPVESQEARKERNRLLQNALKQIDARKPLDETARSKKFKTNPKKPWFDYDCHLLHKKRLRKLARLKKARNQKNEKEIGELRQAIREINREYVPLLRDRKSKFIADLESKGEIGLLCEMAVTSLVDRVVQNRKMERKEKERLAAEEDSSLENKDTSTNDSQRIIVIDDDHEEMEDEHEDDDIGEGEVEDENVNAKVAGVCDSDAAEKHLGDIKGDSRDTVDGDQNTTVVRERIVLSDDEKETRDVKVDGVKSDAKKKESDKLKKTNPLMVGK